MRTIEEQYRLLEELLAQARQRMKAGETEWVEFKANIGESRCSITYEGVGNYISGLSNSACLKYKSHGYLVLGIEDGTWDVVGTNLQMPIAKYGNQDLINELLWNKLPEALNDKQKENKITNLLASLRRDGKIKQGEKRQWVLRLL